MRKVRRLPMQTARLCLRFLKPKKQNGKTLD